MSALKIAHGIAAWEKVCVIDTENGSADLYSHMGPYNVITITPPYEPEKYVDAIRAAERAGMEVIIVDSITHEWQGTGGMLEIADSLLPSIRDGRLIWTKITPRHNRFIDALLQSPAHTISCGRSKQDIIMTETERNGRKTQVPEKVGLKAITREGFDYEMTVSFDLSINHYATCTKDRTMGQDRKALFQDRSPRILDEKVGQTLREWSEEGVADPATLKREIVGQLERLGLFLPADLADKTAFIREAISKLTGLSSEDPARFEAILVALKVTTPERAQEVMFPKPPEVETPPAATQPEPPRAEPPAPEPQPTAPPEPTIEDLNTMDRLMEDANKCRTADEAQAMIHFLIQSGVQPTHIHVLRGIFTSRGLLKA